MACAGPARVGRDRRAPAARSWAGLLWRVVSRGAPRVGLGGGGARPARRAPARRRLAAWLRRRAGGDVRAAQCGRSERGPWPARRDLPPASARGPRGALGRRPAGRRERVGGSGRGQRAGAPAGARAHVDHAHGRGSTGARRRDPQPRARAGARAAALPRQPGAPLWSAGATLALARAPRRRATRTRSGRGTGRWSRSRVRASASSSTTSRRARTGCAATIDSPATGLRLQLRWEAAGLPRLHQWVHPRARIAVLGLEPANCSVLGRAADRAAGRLPMLEPGEERVTRLEFRVSPRG